MEFCVPVEWIQYHTSRLKVEADTWEQAMAKAREEVSNLVPDDIEDGVEGWRYEGWQLQVDEEECEKIYPAAKAYEEAVKEKDHVA